MQKSKWQQFLSDPFTFADGVNLGRLDFFNPLSKFRLSRKIAFFCAIFLGLIPWALFGFDSCIGQPLMMINKLPALIAGDISTNEWLAVWGDMYGKEMHYSAFLIYGLMFWGLSRYFDKTLDIKGSKNVCFSGAITFLSIAIFEFYWMGSFAVFQNQPWMLALQLPQFRIVLQNLIFLAVGVLGMLVIWQHSFILDSAKTKIVGRNYRFRIDRWAALLSVVTVAAALIWIYYPAPVHHFSVELETGEVWHNTNLFPQTLYTVDLNPADAEAVGHWFWFEDNNVHALNTFVKVLVSATVFYIGLVKKENGI